MQFQSPKSEPQGPAASRGGCSGEPARDAGPHGVRGVGGAGREAEVGRGCGAEWVRLATALNKL